MTRTSPATRTEAPGLDEAQKLARAAEQIERHGHACRDHEPCEGCGVGARCGEHDRPFAATWAEAEANLSDGFRIAIRPFLDDRPDPDPTMLYVAYPAKVYVRPGRRGRPDIIDPNSFDVLPFEGYGPTPAAALQALRDKLVAG